MTGTLEAFIRERLPVRPAPSVPEVRLHLAAPSSGVGRLLEGPAYWPYVWAGGAVLARHVLDHPEVVAGRRVLDLGAGSGIAAIAAALAGARSVAAADVDSGARVALALNAALNGVGLEILAGDLTQGGPPDADLVLAGDVFYSRELAAAVEPFLRRCLDAGLEVLVGDPGRRPLPAARLERLAEYRVADFGDAHGLTRSAVYRLDGYSAASAAGPSLHSRRR